MSSIGINGHTVYGARNIMLKLNVILSKDISCECLLWQCMYTFKATVQMRPLRIPNVTNPRFLACQIMARIGATAWYTFFAFQVFVLKMKRRASSPPAASRLPSDENWMAFIESVGPIRVPSCLKVGITVVIVVSRGVKVMVQEEAALMGSIAKAEYTLHNYIYPPLSNPRKYL